MKQKKECQDESRCPKKSKVFIHLFSNHRMLHKELTCLVRLV